MINNEPDNEPIAWTPAKLTKFKRDYAKAITDGKVTFMFEGHEVLVRYAKYLIEYLENRFGMTGDGT